MREVVTALSKTSLEQGTILLVGDSKFGKLKLSTELDEKGILYVFSCGKASPAYLWKYGLHPKMKKGDERAARKKKVVAVCTFSRKRVNLLTNAFNPGRSEHYKQYQVLEYYDANKHFVDELQQPFGNLLL